MSKVVIYKDEAAIIQVTNCLKRIDGKSLTEAMQIVSLTENLDMYCFLIMVSTGFNVDGRTPPSEITQFSKELQKSIWHIIKQTTSKGKFVEYVWNNWPLHVNYLKRSFTKRLVIDNIEVIIGAGYPLFLLNKAPRLNCPNDADESNFSV